MNTSRTFNRRILSTVIAALILSSPAMSRADDQQPWLKDRRYGEGSGIRTGDVVWHPGASAQVGVDSNYFQGSGSSTEPVVGVYRFIATPSLAISSADNARSEGGTGELPKFKFRINSAASFNGLLAMDSAYADDVKEHSYVSGLVDGVLDILPEREWHGDIYANYTHSVQPVNDPSTYQGFNRNDLGAGTHIGWATPGNVMGWKLGYRFGGQLFNDASFTDLSNIHNDVTLNGQWKFFPRTAMLYEGGFRVLDYTSTSSTMVDSHPLWTTLALNGLLTNHFGVYLKGGWKSMFYQTGPTYSGPLIRAEFSWYPKPKTEVGAEERNVGLSAIAMGYERSAENSYIGNYYVSDRGYLNMSYFVGGVVLLNLNGGYSRINRPEIGTTNPAFAENRIDASFLAEYRPTQTVGINLTARYNGSVTPAPVNLENGQVDNLQFSRFELYLGGRWFY